jgi:hypothetical protein
MNEEAPNKTSDSEENRDGAGEERKTRPPKRGSKKVVSRVRDAKSTSADREPKAAPLDSESDAAPEPKEQAQREIQTFIEEAPQASRENRSNNSRDERRKPSRGRRSPQANPNTQTKLESVDVEELAKRAWKIYQADVSEEGIALIDNSTGRQLALRSFELARVFLEEKARQERLCNASADSKGRGESNRSGSRDRGSEAPPENESEEQSDEQEDEDSSES